MSHRAHPLRAALVDRVVHGAGHSSTGARQAAFDATPFDPRVDALLGKVSRQAWTVLDGDVEAALAAGLAEDELFELAVAAAVGQATRQLDAGLAALAAATGTSVNPPAPETSA
jgi:hypothetical protein